MTDNEIVGGHLLVRTLVVGALSTNSCLSPLMPRSGFWAFAVPAVLALRDRRPSPSPAYGTTA